MSQTERISSAISITKETDGKVTDLGTDTIDVVGNEAFAKLQGDIAQGMLSLNSRKWDAPKLPPSPTILRMTIVSKGDAPVNHFDFEAQFKYGNLKTPDAADALAEQLKSFRASAKARHHRGAGGHR